MTTILCIEDEDHIRRDVALELEDEGYTVLVARNGKEGLGLIDHAKPDLILCDLLMPEMDGWAVLEELNKRSADQEIPRIIVMTALTSRNPAKTIDEAKIGGIIDKPIDYDELMKLIEDVLGT